ncbi:hypothetical protein ETAA8_03840 [Anatilimnocola aggregata]|uniref:Uncharacterized protein n=1 Tax=Anatilimnocola aggregata TaxID=2528021 RepID=A0A517Y4Z7_9BACT|nr:hypothetical protein ETAA8_03840 [Anatilimnocola aggregata]
MTARSRGRENQPGTKDWLSRLHRKKLQRRIKKPWSERVTRVWNDLETGGYWATGGENLIFSTSLTICPSRISPETAVIASITCS